MPSAPCERPSAPLLCNELPMGMSKPPVSMNKLPMGMSKPPVPMNKPSLKTFSPSVSLNMDTAVRVLPPIFEPHRKVRPVYHKFTTEEPA